MTRTTLRVGAKIDAPPNPHNPQSSPLRKRAPLPPFWGYQDEQPAKVDVAPVDVAGTAANDGEA